MGLQVHDGSLMECLSRSLWQGLRQTLVLLFLSHVAQHETSLLVSEGNSDLPWGPVSIPSSTVFVKGACIFLGNEQCLTVDVFWTHIWALSASEKANMKLQLFICLHAFKISQPWKYSVWAFCFWIGDLSANKRCFSIVKWILPFSLLFTLSSPCPMPQLHPFFPVLGFQLYLIRSGSGWRPEESRDEMGRSAWPLEAGGTGCGNAMWRERWLRCSVPTAEDTVRAEHQKRQLSQETFWIKMPLFRTKGEFLPVLCDFSAATPGGYTIQADTGSCLSSAEILQKCCAECLNNQLVTKSICRSSHCDTRYTLLLAVGMVPCNQTPQMGSHNVCWV